MPTVTCALCNSEYAPRLGHACVSIGTADIEHAYTSLALVLNTEPAAREIIVTRIEPVLGAFQALRNDVKAFAVTHGVRGATAPLPSIPKFSDVVDHVNSVMRAWMVKADNVPGMVIKDRTAMIRSELMMLIANTYGDDRDALAVLLQDASVALDAVMSDQKPPTFEDVCRCDEDEYDDAGEPIAVRCPVHERQAL